MEKSQTNDVNMNMKLKLSNVMFPFFDFWHSTQKSIEKWDYFCLINPKLILFHFF